MLYDGSCGFCRASVARMLRRDRRGVLRAEPSPVRTGSVRVRLADGSELAGARAVLKVLEHTGWGGWARLLASRPLVDVLELGYRLVARNRHRLSRLPWFRHACEGERCGLR